MSNMDDISCYFRGFIHKNVGQTLAYGQRKSFTQLPDAKKYQIERSRRQKNAKVAMELDLTPSEAQMMETYDVRPSIDYRTSEEHIESDIEDFDSSVIEPIHPENILPNYWNNSINKDENIGDDSITKTLDKKKSRKFSTSKNSRNSNRSSTSSNKKTISPNTPIKSIKENELSCKKTVDIYEKNDDIINEANSLEYDAFTYTRFHIGMTPNPRRKSLVKSTKKNLITPINNNTVNTNTNMNANNTVVNTNNTVVNKNNKIIKKKQEQYTGDQEMQMMTKEGEVEIKSTVGQTKKNSNEISKNDDIYEEWQQYRWKQKCYYPNQFQRIRGLEGVNEEKYRTSQSGDKPYISLKTNSRSGELFFLTSDRRYIIKTISESECHLLKKHLLQYYQHIRSFSYSQLNRILGMYKQTLSNTTNTRLQKQFCPGYTYRLQVLAVVYPPGVPQSFQFDLKGSTHRRKASRKERKKALPCYKDLDFLRWTHRTDEENRAIERYYTKSSNKSVNPTNPTTTATTVINTTNNTTNYNTNTNTNTNANTIQQKFSWPTQQSSLQNKRLQGSVPSFQYARMKLRLPQAPYSTQEKESDATTTTNNTINNNNDNSTAEITNNNDNSTAEITNNNDNSTAEIINNTVDKNNNNTMDINSANKDIISNNHTQDNQIDLSTIKLNEDKDMGVIAPIPAVDNLIIKNDNDEYITNKKTLKKNISKKKNITKKNINTKEPTTEEAMKILQIKDTIIPPQRAPLPKVRKNELQYHDKPECKIHIGPLKSIQLMKQLQRDVDFFRFIGTMDYSLQICISPVQKNVQNQQNYENYKNFKKKRNTNNSNRDKNPKIQEDIVQTKNNNTKNAHKKITFCPMFNVYKYTINDDDNDITINENNNNTSNNTNNNSIDTIPIEEEEYRIEIQKQQTLMNRNGDYNLQSNTIPPYNIIFTDAFYDQESFNDIINNDSIINSDKKIKSIYNKNKDIFLTKFNKDRHSIKDKLDIQNKKYLSNNSQSSKFRFVDELDAKKDIGTIWNNSSSADSTPNSPLTLTPPITCYDIEQPQLFIPLGMCIREYCEDKLSLNISYYNSIQAKMQTSLTKKESKAFEEQRKKRLTLFRRDGGIESEDGSCVYYQAIIDFLCTYNFRKKFGRAFNVLFFCANPKQTSPMPVEDYADRFLRAIHSAVS